MVPPDRDTSLASLPSGEPRSIALVTGGDLRHLRLGYLIQQRFPGRLAAWLTVAPPPPEPSTVRVGGHLARTASGTAFIKTLKRGEVFEAASMVRRRLRPSNLRRLRRQLQRPGARSTDGDLARIEQEMFGAECARLAGQSSLQPTAAADRAALVHALRLADPYLVVVHGGTLPPEAAGIARGAVLAQHDGCLEAFTGPHAVEHALYHRRLSWVGSTTTAHVANQAETALVRYASATLHPDDTVAHCIAAVAALGAGLMLDAVGECLEHARLALAPLCLGKPLVAADYSPAVQEALARDLAAGWLADALAGEQDF